MSRGPCYTRWVQAYYCNSGAWSDGLCAGMQKANMIPLMLCPPLWLGRLYQTLKRSAPLEVGGPLFRWRVTRFNSCRVAATAIILLLLGLSLGGTYWIWLLKTRQHEARSMAVASALLLLGYLMGSLLWAQLLQAVGSKYNILQVLRTPCRFLAKACCCLCAMNVRVGLHVDRAQGFLKPARAVRDMVGMAQSVGVAVRESGVNTQPMRGIRGCTSSEMLEDLEMGGHMEQMASNQRRAMQLGVIQPYATDW